MKTLEDGLQESGILINEKLEPDASSESPQHRHIPVTKDLLLQAERLTKGPVCQVYRVDEKTVVKTGDDIRLAEAATLRLVREKTSVPVPEVLDAYVHAETTMYVS